MFTVRMLSLVVGCGLVIGSCTRPNVAPIANSRSVQTRPPVRPLSVVGKRGDAAGVSITNEGIGAITAIRFIRDDQFVEAVRRTLKTIPGLQVRFEVMDIRGRSVETEEGYVSVRKGDTEVLQIMRPGWASRDDKAKLEVHVLDPMFATADGIRVGDKLVAVFHKRKHVKCMRGTNARIGDLICVGTSEPNILYVIDVEGEGEDEQPVEVAKIGGRKIVEIVWGCSSSCSH